jgi:hypothetical protein
MNLREEQIVLDKAIAYFMGWRIDNSFPDKGKVWRKGSYIELDTTFKFSVDYNALMEVFDAVNKIDGVSAVIADGECKIYQDSRLKSSVAGTSSTKEHVYECLGYFILDYNKSQL